MYNNFSATVIITNPKNPLEQSNIDIEKAGLPSVRGHPLLEYFLYR